MGFSSERGRRSVLGSVARAKHWRAFAEALKIAPDYRPALSALARLRFQRGEWQQLATQLEEDAGRIVFTPTMVMATPTRTRTPNATILILYVNFIDQPYCLSLKTLVP